MAGRLVSGPRSWDARRVVTSSLRSLRAYASAHTLFRAPSLSAALGRLRFVQADPIRAPARAQDLILHQRVEGYRAGDLERHYPSLELEEGELYAYGFLERGLWQLRHPPNAVGLTQKERRLLALVSELGAVHPSTLQAEFGAQRARNAWGGYSTLVKLGLERLHGRGLLRVARREKGIRVYAASAPADAALPARDTLCTLALSVADVLAPVSEQSLSSALRPLARALGLSGEARRALLALRTEGRLEDGVFDGVTYLWPTRSPSAVLREDEPRQVRLLAPFDPLVWDRRRFEHLWGWPYRFEAYTPLARRVRGYYAMPLLWGQQVIGWGNVTREAEQLHAELGFVTKRPREREFGVQLEAELERLRAFLRAPQE
jgi:uncharacterized protein YcaQ